MLTLTQPLDTLLDTQEKGEGRQFYVMPRTWTRLVPGEVPQALEERLAPRPLGDPLGLLVRHEPVLPAPPDIGLDLTDVVGPAPVLAEVEAGAEVTRPLVPEGAERLHAGLEGAVGHLVPQLDEEPGHDGLPGLHGTPGRDAGGAHDPGAGLPVPAVGAGVHQSRPDPLSDLDEPPEGTTVGGLRHQPELADGPTHGQADVLGIHLGLGRVAVVEAPTGLVPALRAVLGPLDAGLDLGLVGLGEDRLQLTPLFHVGLKEDLLGRQGGVLALLVGRLRRRVELERLVGLPQQRAAVHPLLEGDGGRLSGVLVLEAGDDPAHDLGLLQLAQDALPPTGSVRHLGRILDRHAQGPLPDLGLVGFDLGGVAVVGLDLGPVRVLQLLLPAVVRSPDPVTGLDLLGPRLQAVGRTVGPHLLPAALSVDLVDHTGLERVFGLDDLVDGVAVFGQVRDLTPGLDLPLTDGTVRHALAEDAVTFGHGLVDQPTSVGLAIIGVGLTRHGHTDTTDGAHGLLHQVLLLVHGVDQKRLGPLGHGRELGRLLGAETDLTVPALEGLVGGQDPTDGGQGLALPRVDRVDHDHPRVGVEDLDVAGLGHRLLHRPREGHEHPPRIAGPVNEGRVSPLVDEGERGGQVVDDAGHGISFLELWTHAIDRTNGQSVMVETLQCMAEEDREVPTLTGLRTQDSVLILGIQVGLHGLGLTSAGNGGEGGERGVVKQSALTGATNRQSDDIERFSKKTNQSTQPQNPDRIHNSLSKRGLCHRNAL